MSVASVFPRLEPKLPSVQKPIQYVGGELNSTNKDWDCAPDGEPTVLGLTSHPFLVLTRFTPVDDTGGGAPPHPVVPAFVEAARHRARYREWWDAEQARRSAVAAAEVEPRPYVHQMRGPRHRWWRPGSRRSSPTASGWAR